MFIRAYHFYIIDREFGDAYHYYGNFSTTAEVLRFMRENRAAGNTITALDCYHYEGDLANPLQ